MRHSTKLAILLAAAMPLSAQAQGSSAATASGQSAPVQAGTSSTDKEHAVLASNPATDPGASPSTPPSRSAPPAADPTSSKAYGGWDPATASSRAEAVGRKSPNGASGNPTSGRNR